MTYYISRFNNFQKKTGDTETHIYTYSCYTKKKKKKKKKKKRRKKKKKKKIK